MSDALVSAYLATIRGMAGGEPRPMLKRAELEASEMTDSPDVSLFALCAHLRASNPDDLLRRQIHLALAGWDSNVAFATWAEETEQYTRERRRLVYQCLALDEATSQTFDAIFPLSSRAAVVISEEFEPWYTLQRRDEASFYWPKYRAYLLTVRKWRGDSIDSLDTATTSVVERISDPRRPQAFPARGLVVGYVQSGKTAHFTGVIAKAIDAGYRLVIVLTGSIDLLRQQTQRRIDMELVGEENIVRGSDPSEETATGANDYVDDPDWVDGKFARYGFLPSDHGYPDIIRLTTHRSDYQGLQTGIKALELEKSDKLKPLFDQVNLRSSSARLVVVKKNKQVLTKLLRDLKSIRPNLGEIPAIMIDDESDHSSVNTSDPKKWTAGQKQRTAINALVSQLLGLLPRCQYVGYTATPYANVFIDPSDTEDIFPKDFLISLERAPDYMGVDEFHDLDTTLTSDELSFANSNEMAHVRGLYGFGAERAPEMLKALDAFVLSGAIKIYRAVQLGRPELAHHHTMLVHESVRQADHRVLADEFRAVWRSAGYATGSGLDRVRRLFEDDFKPVSLARGGSWPIPDDFADLPPHIGEAISRMTESNGDPILIINGDKEIQQQRLDFDRTRVWRILVGGTKLSRGFTVEGLTISYYRRLTKQADTLMQMGRWFGFRTGYKDLVRLFVGRAEPDGKKAIDLYEAFGAIVRDEESFREQLKQYAQLVDGKPQITPRQIPPLVSQHLPFISPSAPNKMFNAELVMDRTPGRLVEPTAYPTDRDDILWNYDAMAPLARAASDRVQFHNSKGEVASETLFDAYVACVPHDELMGALEKLRWLTPSVFKAHLAYLREIGELAQVSDWLVILPQIRDDPVVLRDIGRRSVHERERRRGPLFGGISDPKHRGVAYRVAGAWPQFDDPTAETWAAERRGAVLIYPIREPDGTGRLRLPEDRALLSLSFVAPSSATSGTTQLVQFVAKDRAKERDAIVAG